MYEHPNMLSSELSQDKKFTQEMAQALEKFFDSSDVSFVKTKLLDSKIITDKRDVYLIIKKNGAYSVYHDIMFSDKPFLYLKESLKKNSEIYATVLYASKPKVGQMLGTKFKSLLDKINDSDKSLKATPEDLAKIFGVALGDGFKTTSSPYDLKMFFQFLNKKGFLDTKIEDSFLEVKSSAVAKAIDYQEELLISTDFLMDMANKHKLSVKKKFEFNDLDNHMWKQYDGLVVTDQNCAFYIVKNDNTYTYYAWDKERTGGKKNQSLSSLVKDISQNPESLIDNIALKIVDNKIVFVDNAFIYSLSFDIHHTKLAFMNEHEETLEYPVDIRSYDYQLAYHKKHYGMTEFEFVASAVLSYSHYDYDKTKKVFYRDDVTYESNLVNVKNEPDTKKQKSFSYCILSGGFNYDLDDKWKAGIVHMVNVLKNDKPVPVVSDSKDKTKDVEKVIEFFENVISNFETKAKKVKP